MRIFENCVVLIILVLGTIIVAHGNLFCNNTQQNVNMYVEDFFLRLCFEYKMFAKPYSYEMSQRVNNILEVLN